MTVRLSQLSVAVGNWRPGPYLIALFWLIAGYLHYAPGTAYSLSSEHYRAWAFPSFRYSDVIWLYLRDNLAARPIPYIDYSLEYPPLTGLLSWILSWAPDLPAYFAGAYLVLAASALITIWALDRLTGANPWLFAASPALFFYTGHQWDLAAIAVTALSLVALQTGRRNAGVAGLAVGVSLKLFPLVFFAGLMIESLRDRKWLQAIRDGALFALVTALANLPVAAANREGWSFFFRWNRDRLADSGVWVLWRDVATTDLTRWSLVAAVCAGAVLSVIALRQRGPLTIPLGAAYLVWWLLLNKTFTTHLMLWAILALALVSAPIWLWVSTTVIDAVGFQVGNYLNLYNIPTYQHAPLIRMAVENIYDPLQIARTGVLGASAIWLVQLLMDPHRRDAFATQPEQHSLARATVHFEPVFAPTLRSTERRLGVVAALFVLTAATILMTWPYAAQASVATAVGFDPYLQIWLSEWIHHALSTNPTQLYEANMFFPFSQTLAYTDANIPGALAALPVRVLTGDPIMTNTILVLGSFLLAGLGTFLLVRSVTGNQAVGLVAALAYAFLPYRMIHLWHLNWLEGALFPWFILALLRLLDRPTPARGLVLGALAAVITLISFYFAPQLILISVIVTGAIWVSRRSLPDGRFWRVTALSGVVALAIALPFLFPYLQVHQQQRLERTLTDAEQYKALPTSYLQLAPWDVPDPFQQALGVRAAPNLSLTEVGQDTHADGHRHAEIVTEDALYPGLLVLVLAAFALVRGRPRWLVAALLVIAATAALLSLGPSWGPHHGDNRQLPYAWLFDHVPFFRAMRVPARLGGLVDLALVLLAALGMQAAWQVVRGQIGVEKRHAVGVVLTALLSICVLADLWTGPVPLEQVERTAEAMSGANWLADQPPGPVMEFPAESVFADPAAASVRRHSGETLFRSTIHWLPMVNGNSGFIPRAYSDFIERFVGELPRPNGTTTGPLSYVDTQSVQLLHQLGLRYVVFNVEQYAADDWLAVEGELEQLVEQGDLVPAGIHGHQQIYVLTPAQPGPPLPDVYLFAPTLLMPGDPWFPWLGMEASTTPSTLALTRPAQLTLDWYDDAGRRIKSSHHVLPLPAVMDDEALLCSPNECLTSRPFADLRRLPGPDQSSAWIPEEPGHYVVQARLSGDRSLSCQIDLDVVDKQDELEQSAGDDPHRWASCLEDFAYPVNNPGSPPYVIDDTEVALSGNTIGVEFTVQPRRDELLRAWFILSPRGLPDPWRVAAYQSPAEETLARSGEPARFQWNVALTDPLPSGAYDLTVWVHHQAEGAWQHAVGGPAIHDGVIVDADGALRRAGPLEVKLHGTIASLTPGKQTDLPIEIRGAQQSRGCSLRWELVSLDGSGAREGISDCSHPRLTLPGNTPTGSSRLTVDVYDGAGESGQISDGFSTTVTVNDTAVERPN